MDLILKYFPEISYQQQQTLASLKPLYEYWNDRINVISRNDIVHFYERHLLFSLSVSKIISFIPGTRVIDVGTGGGFPGIPLAILFPDTQFTLMDSIAKKTKVVNEIIKASSLQNTVAITSRSEGYHSTFDFILGRAVASLPVFIKQTYHLILPGSLNTLPNGIIYLRGGNDEPWLNNKNYSVREWPLKNWFEGEFFETKKVIHITRHT
ncbi:MAG: 16S rRNA (guanine(527)-N(7))-methyltransferase RsmG [Bacteroidetes bacterium]|nr:16S rRNA (guanine(527)-N(7))-methyltransferase RsmG [Bacteroidota bacterium]